MTINEQFVSIKTDMKHIKEIIDQEIKRLNSFREELITTTNIFNIKRMERVAENAGVSKEQWKDLEKAMRDEYQRFIENDLDTMCPVCGADLVFKTENVGFQAPDPEKIEIRVECRCGLVL